MKEGPDDSMPYCASIRDAQWALYLMGRRSRAGGPVAGTHQIKAVGMNVLFDETNRTVSWYTGRKEDWRLFTVALKIVQKKFVGFTEGKQGETMTVFPWFLVEGALIHLGEDYIVDKHNGLMMRFWVGDAEMKWNSSNGMLTHVQGDRGQFYNLEYCIKRLLYSPPCHFSKKCGELKELY